MGTLAWDTDFVEYKSDLRHDFEKLDAKGDLLRKDMDVGFVKVRHEVSDLRKDMETNFAKMQFRIIAILGTLIVGCFGVLGTVMMYGK